MVQDINICQDSLVRELHCNYGLCVQRFYLIFVRYVVCCSHPCPCGRTYEVGCDRVSQMCSSVRHVYIVFVRAVHDWIRNLWLPRSQVLLSLFDDHAKHWLLLRVDLRQRCLCVYDPSLIVKVKDKQERRMLLDRAVKIIGRYLALLYLVQMRSITLCVSCVESCYFPRSYEDWLIHQHPHLGGYWCRLSSAEQVGGIGNFFSTNMVMCCKNWLI